MKTHPDTLVHLLDRSARQFADAPAILAPGMPPLTHGKLSALIGQTHHYLNARGLGVNCRIATVLPDSPAVASAFLAISASCTFAPLNPAYKDDELESHLANLDVAALITLRDFESPIRRLADKLNIPLLEIVPESDKGAGYFSLTGETGLPAADTGYADADDIAMLLHTSGSTASPKIVPFRQQALCLALKASNRQRTVGPQDRCLNALPLFHMQGLLAVASPVIFGGSCVYASPFEPGRFIEWLNEFDPTLYSATPTMHQAILEQAQRTANFRKNPSLRFFSSSSAALPLKQLHALEATFEVPLVEAYGMTETLHISGNLLPPGIRKPGSAGIATDTEISIVDDSGRPLPAGATGEIVVQSPWVMTGYINNDQANKSAFCARGFRTGDIGHLDEEGYLFVTGRVKEVINRGGEKISPHEVDRVLLAHPAVKDAAAFPVPHPMLGENLAAAVVVKDGAQVDSETLRQFARQRLAEFKIPYRIIFSDRLPRSATGKIQRHKMAGFFAAQLAAKGNASGRASAADASELARIEAVLQQHPAVLNAIVLARDADPDGKLPVFFIAKRQDASLTLQELRDFLSQRLPPRLVHGRIFLVNRLPVKPSGEVDRDALADMPLPRAEARSKQQEPYNALQATLLEIWSQLLQIPGIGIDENFFELGGDSYKVVTMLHQVEKLTRWSVPLAVVYDNPTVELLAHAMLEHKGEYNRSPLVEIQAGASAAPFFFMHGDFHGGGFFCYQLARFMGPDQAVYAIQPHGLPGRPAPTTIEDMAAESLELIRAAFPSGPYFLGGHCNGALVAFEVAQRLLAARCKVGLLVMMDPPPVQGRAASGTGDARFPVGPEQPITSIDLDKLSPGDRHDTVMQLYSDICRNYAPKFYPGKLTFFVAKDTPALSDPGHGWKSLAKTAEIHLVPGNHVSMLTVNVPAISKKLVECRDRAAWD